MFPRSRCEVRAMVDLLWGVGGMAGLLLIALALSSNRRAIRLRTVLGAFALQVLLGVLVLYWGPGQWALERVSTGFQAVIDTSGEGIDFLLDRKSTRLNSSHVAISYAVFCLKKK